jgi:Ca-activated chloride channel family protein
MLARDFKPNRLEALKKVASEFAYNRFNDRIGVVVYAAESYTKTPVTSDKPMVLESIKSIKYDNVIQDGTGIVMGLSTAVNRLKDSQAKSKVIILLTDGVNNSGYISPITATDIAVEFGVKVYTIAIGSRGTALVPMNMRNDGTYYYGMGQVEIDIELLQEIAEKTRGKFFRATDRESLENIYSEIDRLEKSEIDMSVFKRYKDEYRLFLSLGFISLILYFVFKNSIFRTLN